MGFLEKFKEQFQQDVSNQKQKRLGTQVKRLESMARKDELERQGVLYCPKCLSTSVQAFKKGFGIGKAAIGGMLLGGIGLLGGAIGKDKVEMRCLKCGHKYDI